MVIKFISIGEYFEKIIKFYLNNLIYYYRQKEEWKLQLSMKINFISFTRENVSDIMHSKINNVEELVLMILLICSLPLLLKDFKMD